MRNFNFYKNKIEIIFVILVLSPFFTIQFTWAGNAAIIEKEIDQLDQLNKSIVRNIPALPKNGNVKTKAIVSRKKKNTDIVFKTFDKETSLEKEGRIQLDDNQKITNFGTTRAKDNDNQKD
jgi:hypothetical protein